MKAILIERDYKGIYERFALTPDEFIAEFPDIANITTQGTYTISPMVHIWYSPCIVGDNMWNLFFTDMTWGLPDTDINIGNLAYVNPNIFKTLIQYLPIKIHSNGGK